MDKKELFYVVWLHSSIGWWEDEQIFFDTFDEAKESFEEFRQNNLPDDIEYISLDDMDGNRYDTIAELPFC